MQKKVFLQRNLRKGGGGGPPYMKYLMISAVCLVLLVLITPYLFKRKKQRGHQKARAGQGNDYKRGPQIGGTFGAREDCGTGQA